MLRAMENVRQAREGLGLTAFASSGIATSTESRPHAEPQASIPSYMHLKITNAESGLEENNHYLRLDI